MLDAVILAGVALCVLPANVFAIWYGVRGTWRGNEDGRALLVYAAGLATWLDLELLYGLFDLPGDRYVSLALLVLIGAGTWLMLVTWARSRRRP